ncbi:MAG: helix-turn-helix domain-containing protein [Mycoplasma sp.]
MEKNLFDISDFVDVLTDERALYNLVDRFIKRRKESKISQKDLSKTSGVSYGSLRRFENTGEISLKSLIKLMRCLGYLEDLELLFKYCKVTNIRE